MELLSGNKLSLDIFKLIQPDLLSIQELTHILQERCVVSSLLSQSKEKLVSLFKRVALPLPQRTLRETYRESLLSKLRKKAERKKISTSSSDDRKSYTIGTSGNPNMPKSNIEPKSEVDRLKPPPDLINHERKKIRLNSTSSSETRKTSPSTDLDKIIIKRRKTSESSSDSVTDKNGIVVRQSSEKESSSESSNMKEKCNGLINESTPKKVSLKRNLASSNVSRSTQETSNSAEPDKKHKKITWP